MAPDQIVPEVATPVAAYVPAVRTGNHVYTSGQLPMVDGALPVTGKGPPAYSLKNYGAFQDKSMTRNDMKRAIGESEFTHFMFNDAIVDKVFFDLEPGTIGAPPRSARSAATISGYTSAWSSASGGLAATPMLTV